MTPREQALLQDAFNWIRSRYPANSILPDHARMLLDRLAAALANHAAPQDGSPEALIRERSPAGAAPAFVSPQGLTGGYVCYNCINGMHSLGHSAKTCACKVCAAQGGTAAGADWVKVPRNPTEKMVEAGRAAMAQQNPQTVSHARVLWVWKDMLSAAPRPDAGEDKDAVRYRYIRRSDTDAAVMFDESGDMLENSALDRAIDAARALGRGEGKP